MVKAQALLTASLCVLSWSSLSEMAGSSSPELSRRMRFTPVVMSRARDFWFAISSCSALCSCSQQEHHVLKTRIA